MKKVLTVAVMLMAMVVAAQGLRNLPGRMGANSRRSALNRNRQTDNQATPRPEVAPPTQPESATATGEAPALNWDAVPVDIVLQAYGEQVDKTILKDPSVPNATITLKSRQGQQLKKEDYLQAIEAILEMNGIHLEAYGDRFIRALPSKDVRRKGIPLIMDPDSELKESTRVVSMMIPFKNITTEEAQKALEGFKSNEGILLVFERTNSILVTDSEQNINRMLEIARAIDISTPVLENVFVRQIKNASATEIKTALEAIVQESQKETEKNGKVPANQPQAARQTSGTRLLGRNQNQPAAPVNQESLVMSVSDADRGMIRGKVLILADERSNKLIIVTSKSNMDFFDKVIEQLDVETTPDTVVKVYRLKYADSEDVSDMINDLIGNAASSKSSSKNNQNQNAKKGGGSNITSGRNQGAAKSANQRTGEAKAGELSKENTTVLSDKRINGLVVMTNKELVPVIEQIIESMDVKLAQVLIETCIIEVGLGHDIKTGLDWVHGIKKNADGSRYTQALGGGGGSASAVAGAATNALKLIDGAATQLPSIFTPGAGLNYAVFSEGLNLAAIISLSQSDSTSKYIASPVVMTVDNKEATIEATQSRRFLSGYQSNSSSSYYGSSIVPQYEGKDIGIKIKVTPKINPNGTVMLEVEEEYSQVGPTQAIQDPNSKSVDIDTSLTRKMSADVVLDNSQTVVLGGLTETHTSTSDSGIPILKDIPLVGKYLFGKTSTAEERSELLVFLTPYVLADGDEAEAEAIRRKRALSDPTPWDDHGWSASKLADPVSKKEQMRRLKAEWKRQDEERQTKLAIENQKVERVEKLKSMDKTERDHWLELHKKELEEEKQKELEEKMLDSESQDALKKLAEEIRARELKNAEAKIKEGEAKAAEDPSPNK